MPVGKQYVAARHFAWAVPLAPACVVVHELGHLLTGRAFGYPTRLHPESVSGGPALETSEPLIAGLAAASGPLASTLLTAIACLFILKRGPHPAIIVLALFDSLRIAVTILGICWRVLITWQGVEVGPLDSDEYDALRAFGTGFLPVMIAINLLLIATWAWTIRRIEGSRPHRLVAIAGGSAVGLVLWFNLIGPALLG